jgi:hypothetical protein
MAATAKPEIRGFFDEPTNKVSYLVWDPATKESAVIDPVLNFDHRSGMRRWSLPTLCWPKRISLASKLPKFSRRTPMPSYPDDLWSVCTWHYNVLTVPYQF